MEPEMVPYLEPQISEHLEQKTDDIGGLGEASNQVISMTTIGIRHGNYRGFSKLAFEKLAKLIIAVMHRWP